jgi:hypothetical protein
MADKTPVSLARYKARKKQEEVSNGPETSNDSPALKPKFDPDTYFQTITEQNAKAKEREVADKAKRNALTKRRYKIKDTEK